MKESFIMKRIIAATALCFMMLFGIALAGEDPVLAKVGDWKLTLSDFNRLTGYYDADKQKALKQNPEYKVVILQRLIQGRVFSDLARKKGFDKREDIREQLKIMQDDFLSLEFLKEEVISKIAPTEEDMSSYYKTHKDEFSTPEMVRVRHILVKVDKAASDDVKKQALERAEAIMKRIRNGEDFAKLAAELSEDPASKGKGGDLGFFPRGKMVPDFEKAAFSLKAGEVGDIILSQFGYHLIKVEEKKAATLEPYETTRERVRARVVDMLKKNALEEYTAKVMKDAGLEVHSELLLPPAQKPK
jgi:peptidyl-prolyl cis-trans isomerase C